MKKFKQMIYAWISEKYMNGCSNYNSLEVRRGCRSKQQGRAIFAANDVPHARGLVFLSPLKAHRFAKEHGFPLVVKPNVSGYSRGSYFPINNFKDLWKGILLAKIWWPTTIIEQYLQGANYRVLTSDSAIISAIRRYPPFIIGDGKNTISTLIDEEKPCPCRYAVTPGYLPY